VETWVRNPQFGDRAFRMKTAGGWFYPDFVGRLADGRHFVVEYKGKVYAPIAKEDEALGEFYESRSGGRCLFIMVINKDWPALQKKLAARS
jgi:type III restriction enzyme